MREGGKTIGQGIVVETLTDKAPDAKKAASPADAKAKAKSSKKR